jgi:hypothetical protein
MLLDSPASESQAWRWFGCLNIFTLNQPPRNIRTESERTQANVAQDGCEESARAAPRQFI